MSRRAAMVVLSALALAATGVEARAALPVIDTTPAGIEAFTGSDLSLDGRAFAPAASPADRAADAALGKVDAGLRIGAIAADGHRRPAVRAAAPARVSRLPEPATWGMMIVGFGLIGSVVRRGLRKSDERFDAYIRSITDNAEG